jgi:hypothetical protein
MEVIDHEDFQSIFNAMGFIWMRGMGQGSSMTRKRDLLTPKLDNLYSSHSLNPKLVSKKFKKIPNNIETTFHTT